MVSGTGPASPSALPASPDPSLLVGRQAERDRLRLALSRAKAGQGRALLVLGPGGMGKTRLLRWLESEAREEGFQVRWGNALKEAIAPFFAFRQIFRREADEAVADPARAKAGSVPPSDFPQPLPSVLVVEEDRPKRIREGLSSLKGPAPLLLVSRDSPNTLRERGIALGPESRSLWITRMEGEGRIAPGDLDRLGEIASGHLQRHPKGVVVLEGIEYLASQSSFSAVLRLLQFLRDVAQETEGHLLVSINPTAFEKKEVSLLESDAEVLRAPAGPLPGEGPRGSGADGAPERPEPPSETLLRFLSTLEKSSASAPQLLVVDDLHWADAQSGTTFQFLARNLQGLRVLLVAGAREDELPATSSTGERSLVDHLDALTQEGLLDRVELRPWGVAEATQMVGALLGTALAPGQEARMAELVRRTEGNPYFLRETLLQLRESGALHPGPQGIAFAHGRSAASGIAHLPSSLRRLVLRRLALLAPAERAFLDTAALTGSEFDLPPVAFAMELSAPEAHHVAERLERQFRLLERSTATTHGAPAWTFTHPLVWEGTLAELGPTERRKKARTLLDWWEEHRPDEMDTLARLAHATADPDRALPFVHEALVSAIDRYAPEAAFTYLSWQHELLREGRHPTGEQLAGEVKDARRVARSGGSRAVEGFLRELLEEDLGKEVRWAARYALASTLEIFNMGECRRLSEELQRDIAHDPGSVPAAVRHGARSLHAYILAQSGRFDEAMTEAGTIVSAPASEMDGRIRSFSFLLLVRGAIMQGDLGRARQLLDQASEDPSDDPMAAARLTEGRALVASQAGDLGEAVKLFREAAERSRRLGDLTLSLLDEADSANSLIKLGRLEEAEAVGQRLADLGRKFDLPRARFLGAYTLGLVERTQGRPAAGLTWAEHALREAQLLSRRDDILESRVLVAELRGRTGRASEAIAEFESLEREGLFDSPPEVVEYLPGLADVQELHGDLPAASATAQRILKAARTLRNEVAIRAAQARLDRLQRAREGGGATTAPPPGPPKG